MWYPRINMVKTYKLMEKSSEHDLKMVRKHHIHGSLQEEKSNKHPQFYQKRGMMSYSL